MNGMRLEELATDLCTSDDWQSVDDADSTYQIKAIACPQSGQLDFVTDWELIDDRAQLLQHDNQKSSSFGLMDSQKSRILTEKRSVLNIAFGAVACDLA